MYAIAAESLKPSEVTVLLLDIAVLLGLARVLGELARRWHMPAVLGEILAGIVLGPTLLGAFLPVEMFTWVFPPEGDTTVALDGFVLLSATLLLFVVGLEVDLSTVWRQGLAAISVSIGGIALPFAVGFIIAYGYPGLLGAGPRGANAPIAFAVFVGIALSITALPVIAKILLDLNLAKSDMGMLIISSAMLNDLVGWIGFAVVLALLPVAPGVAEAAASNGGGQVVTTIVLTIAFLVLMLTVGRWLCHRALPYVQAHWSWPGGTMAFVFVIALLCAAFTEYLGIHSIFGAFIAGVAIGDSHHLKERTRDTIHQFVMNIFAPVFFASIGLRINFIDKFDLTAVAIVGSIALFGKVAGSFLGARVSRMSYRESFATGFGMAAQGAVGIILGQLARDAGLISDELMVAIVIMALGTSMLSGPAMQRILQRKQKRTLLSFLTDKHVITEPKARDINQSIGELSRRAAEITGLEGNAIYEAVLQRERIMHTGLPHGLAVPHARLDDLPRPCLVIARNRTGIDFDAADGEPARLIALLLTPSDQPDTQIELLSLFATTFNRAAVRRQAMEIQTPTEFLAMLNQAGAESELILHDDHTLGMP